jgi:uncharacterized membrane protein
MAPLVILLISFSLLFLLNKFLLHGKWSLSFTGRLAMAIMLLFTGITHFTHTDLMVAMMPDWLPYKPGLVYFSGLLEWAAALGLLFPGTARISSVGLILFFLAVLPANILGSLREVPLGGMEQGAGYLYFRIPLQVFFILWVYFFGLGWNKT